MTVLKGLAEGGSKDAEFANAFALVLAGSGMSDPVVRNIVSNARDGMYAPRNFSAYMGKRLLGEPPPVGFDWATATDEALARLLPAILVRDYAELVPVMVALIRDIYLKK